MTDRKVEGVPLDRGGIHFYQVSSFSYCVQLSISKVFSIDFGIRCWLSFTICCFRKPEKEQEMEDLENKNVIEFG